MSDVAASVVPTAAQKLAAVWEPAPMLKTLASKHFVRVQDARGQTSHFTLTTYRHLTQPSGGGATLTSQPHAGHSSDVMSESGHASDSPEDESLEAVRQQAYEQGLQDGRRQAQSEHVAQAQAHHDQAQIQVNEQVLALLGQIQTALQGFQEDGSTRYEPLKRLALHLAEQLVLSELSLSSAAIEGLVRRCVQALDQPSASEVLVELHPGDLTLLQSAMPQDETPPWRLQANPDLTPGSVQVSANDAMVQDLIEHRLQALAQDLLEDPKRWQAQSSFSPQGLQMRQNQALVQDVQSKASTRASPMESSATQQAPAFPFPLSREDLELSGPVDASADAADAADAAGAADATDGVDAVDPPLPEDPPHDH